MVKSLASEFSPFREKFRSLLPELSCLVHRKTRFSVGACELELVQPPSQRIAFWKVTVRNFQGVGHLTPRLRESYYLSLVDVVKGGVTWLSNIKQASTLVFANSHR